MPPRRMPSHCRGRLWEGPSRCVRTPLIRKAKPAAWSSSSRMARTTKTMRSPGHQKPWPRASRCMPLALPPKQAAPFPTTTGMDASRDTNPTTKANPLCRPSTNACWWPWRKPDKAPMCVPCKASWTSPLSSLPSMALKRAKAAPWPTPTTSTNSHSSSPSGWRSCSSKAYGPPAERSSGPPHSGSSCAPLMAVWRNLPCPERRNGLCKALRPCEAGTLQPRTACLRAPVAGKVRNRGSLT